MEPWRLEPHRLALYAGDGKYKAYPYWRLISEKIARAVGAGNGRLIISLPPGHGKSSLASFWTPIWFLNNFPAEKVIMTSHGDALATDWGRKVRNEFDQNPRLTTKLSSDSTAAAKWYTPEGGGMLAAGVGSGITGFRANLILVDDPHPTWEAAMSVTHRTHSHEWFNGTLYDRQEPNGSIIVLAHRWHEDDLPGYLIGHHSDKWDVVRLPALAEVGDPLGRQPGEALCPERFSKEALERTRPAVGELVWAAKFQQNPKLLGGGRVYDAFLPDLHLDNTLALRDNLDLHVSFDFNRNPGMHVELGQYDTAADLLTCVHEVHGPYMKLQAALEGLGNLIRDLGGFKWPKLIVFGDASGTQDRAETTATAYQQVADWLDRQGWPYDWCVPSANPPVRDRIDTMNTALRDHDGDVHYKVHPRCERMVADLKWLKADEQGLIDKRDQKLSHATDAEGYRVFQLRPIGGQVQFIAGSAAVLP